MKSLIVLSLIVSSVAMASGFITGESSYVDFQNGARKQLQVTISGKSAEALYNSLDVRETEMSDEHGGAAYGASKHGENVFCDRTYDHFSCTFMLNEQGQIAR